MAKPSARAGPCSRRHVARRQSRGGDRGGGIDDRRPVALHPAAERMLREHQHRGEGQRGEQRPDGIARPPRLPCGEHHPGGEHDEYQRCDETDLSGDQFADEAGGACRLPLRHASALTHETRPAVGSIPEHHGQENQPTDQGAKPCRRVPQLAAKRRCRQQPQRNSEPEQRSGVFAGHRKAGEQPDWQPPHGLAAVQKPRQRPDAAGPEEQQRRVGGHDHRADAEQQRRIEQRGREQPRAPPGQQAIGRVRQQQRGSRHRKRTQQPYAERRVAGHERAEAHPQRHHRRMVGISGRQGTRPDPVIRLVRRRRGGRGEAEAQQCQRDKRPKGQQTLSCRVTGRATPVWPKPRNSTPRRSPRRSRRRCSTLCGSHTACSRCRHWRPRQHRTPA